MKKLAVIHYLPLEYYPPTTNFLDIIADYQNIDIKVWSTTNSKKRKEYQHQNIKAVHRSLLPQPNDNTFVRLIKYFGFNLKTFWGLVKYRPTEIIYYESYSAFPVYWYIKIFGNKTRLYIHFHEYFSLDWYKNGMNLVKYYHRLEQRFLFSKAIWISQTNQQRIDLFLKDNEGLNENKMKVLANYPPQSWMARRVSTLDYQVIESIKTVYVGSLSLKDTYLKAYCEWVITQNGKVLFDIYAYNLHNDTIVYLQSLKSTFIRFFEDGIDYHQLPQVLAKYEVGIIFYKAFSENYKFNAPNKLFEYMACGLQVWFSTTMDGVKSYRSQSVAEVDFENDNSLSEALNKNRNQLVTQTYVAEYELKSLIDMLLKL